MDSGIAVPLRLRSGPHQLCFLSTITTFGTAIEITASELSIESFFPADIGTAEFLCALTPEVIDSITCPRHRHSLRSR